MIPGIDVSWYDPLIDWESYPYDFVFIKEGEGTYQDVDFKLQWAAAKGKVLRGPYNYFRPTVSPVTAARSMLARIENDPGELPPVLDLESHDNVPFKDVVYRAKLWLDEVEKTLKRVPIVYSSRGFVGTIQLAYFSKLFGYEFERYPLWQAEYPWDRLTGTWTQAHREAKLHNVLNQFHTVTFPSAPAPWTGKPSFWQFTGMCPPQYIAGYPLGKKKAVDGNFYYGTISDMFNQFRIADQPPEEGEPPMEDKPITLTANLRAGAQSNLRNMPGTTGTVVLTPPSPMTGPLSIRGVGTKVIKDNYHWIEIVFPYRGWVALTTSYENVTYTPTSPTQPPPQPTTRTVVKSVLHYSDGTTQEMT